MTFPTHRVEPRRCRRPLRRVFRSVVVSAGMATIAFAVPVSRAAPPAIPDSPDQIEPLLIGSPLPETQVRTVDGQQTSLAEVIGGDPAVIVFYRGGW